MVHNKGGCKVGRKEHGTKGGCKVGKRNPTKAEKEVAKAAAKKGKKLLKAPAKAKAPAKPKEAKGVMKSKADKKARIQQKVRDLGKAQIAKKKEKKKDFTAKPKPKPTAGQKLTGLTKAQMNAMSPAELFGRLPVGVAKGVVLNPKRTGVKVAQDPRKAFEEFVKKGEAKREGMGGRIEELKQKYMDEFKAKGLKVPALKDLMRKANMGGGYNKGQMIERLALIRAEKETGYKELGDKLFSARSKERGRLKQADADKEDREIQEARKNPKKPSEKEIDEFRLDMARHSAAMRQMRGPAYAGSRERSEKRLQHRYRNIFGYRAKHGGQFIDSVIASLGTPRGYEFQ